MSFNGGMQLAKSSTVSAFLENSGFKFLSFQSNNFVKHYKRLSRLVLMLPMCSRCLPLMTTSTLTTCASMARSQSLAKPVLETTAWRSSSGKVRSVTGRTTSAEKNWRNGTLGSARTWKAPTLRWSLNEEQIFQFLQILVDPDCPHTFF